MKDNKSQYLKTKTQNQVNCNAPQLLESKIMSEKFHLLGASFKEMFTFECGRTVPVYELSSYHALNQMIGYAKFLNKDFGNVYCRGEANLHASLIPSLYRKYTSSIHKAGTSINSIVKKIYLDENLRKELKLCDMDEKLASYCIEGMLQHYGVPTRFVDIVDNHWIALWMGLNKATNLKQINHYYRYQKRSLPIVDFLIDQHCEKALYQYLLLIAVPTLNCAYNNGIYLSKKNITIDLRQALPSYFLRPHAQHGLVVRKISQKDSAEIKDFDIADSVVGILKVRIDNANNWLGDGALLTQDNLFPPPAFDHGYDLLLSRAELFLGCDFSIAKYI